MSAEVVLATSNPGKLREVRAILAEWKVAIRPVSDFPGVVFPEEGADYEPNAIAKARTAALATDRYAIADDSGLEVQGLDGGPGPMSARFGGPGLDDSGRVSALLAALESVAAEGRRARFVCIAALAGPEGDVVTARGECAGRILEDRRGRSGFGYDPIFEVEARGVSMAELPEAEKNRLSHRALAFRELAAAILSRAGERAPA